jgi:polar amino acid transport system substrate-binding protein
LLRVFFLWVVVAVAFGGPAAAREPGNGGGILRAAWVPTGTGLISPITDFRRFDDPIDLQILQAAAQRAHLGLVIVPMGRAAAEAAVADGRLDLLLPDSVGRGTVSAPFRSERDVLLCARSLPPLAREGAGVLEEAHHRGWRIGFVRDAPYRADIATVMTNGAVAGRTSYFGDAGQAVLAVAEGAIECMVAPRLSILSALGAAPMNESFIARKAVDLGATELRLRFADSVSPGTVAALDSALASLWKDGTIADLEERAGRPVLLRFAIATWWFSWLDVVGTIAFALSGVLIARAERFSFLGAVVLAGLPAVGGGVVRDLLLGRSPIGILGDPQPLFLILGTVVVAYGAMAVAQRIGKGPSERVRSMTGFVPPRIVLEVTDALGLAAFTVIGVVVAVRTGAEPLWLWGPVAAGLSGAGGGILRDLLRSGYENPALRTSFYAEVCVLWGALLTLAIIHFLQADQPGLVRITVAVTVLGGFATRMAVVVYGIRSPRF